MSDARPPVPPPPGPPVNNAAPTTTLSTSFTIELLTQILNGQAPFDRVRELPALVARDKGLKKSDDKMTAFKRMDQLGITWLPVTDRTKLIGIVDEPTLAAGLVLDVAKALEAAR